MYSCLMLVTERFPGLGARVACLFDSDPVLRDPCEGYEICTTALARQPSSAGLSDEYAALQLRLETKLLRHPGEDLLRHGQPPVAEDAE